MLSEEWLYRYEDHKTGDRQGYDIVAGLVQYGKNPRPHWSVQVDTLRSGHIVAYGCQHDLAVKLWPWIAPVVALHLSDDRGVPMHAIDNGIYWLGVGDPRWADARNLETFKSHLRLTDEEVARIDDYVTNDPGMASEALRFCLHDIRPRWQEESNAAKALLVKHGATVSVDA